MPDPSMAPGVMEESSSVVNSHENSKRNNEPSNDNPISINSTLCVNCNSQVTSSLNNHSICCGGSVCQECIKLQTSDFKCIGI